MGHKKSLFGSTPQVVLYQAGNYWKRSTFDLEPTAEVSFLTLVCKSSFAFLHPYVLNISLGPTSGLGFSCVA